MIPQNAGNSTPMDLESRRRWAEYSRAKDERFALTDITQAPCHVVNPENKGCARLNLIRHLLSLIAYQDLTPERLKLPALDKNQLRPAHAEQNFIPEVYSYGRQASPVRHPQSWGFVQYWLSGAQLFTMSRDGSRSPS
jgi:hypothetical protein